MHAFCALLPDLGLASAETAKSDDAILLKLEEDFTCPITQVSLASTAPFMLCVTALNITNLLATAAFAVLIAYSHSACCHGACCLCTGLVRFISVA